ncbi:GNAT family N-acetyltransferase [soil metagenome]
MSLVGVRPLEPGDWSAVEQIYTEGIATGNATFEAEPPSWEQFDQGKRSDLRFVAFVDDSIVGWAAASAVSTREVYRGVVEHSVYVAEPARGTGVGDTLLAALIDAAEDAGVWTIQSGVFPENIASLRLHERHGFRTVGRRERIALMSYGPHKGVWRDTILVERRRGDLTPRPGQV